MMTVLMNEPQALPATDELLRGVEEGLALDSKAGVVQLDDMPPLVEAQLRSDIELIVDSLFELVPHMMPLEEELLRDFERYGQVIERVHEVPLVEADAR